MQIGGRVGRRTVENPADGKPGETRLLAEVRGVSDIWSIRSIRPRLLLKVRHGSDAPEEGKIELGRREFRDGEKVLELDGREATA